MKKKEYLVFSLITVFLLCLNTSLWAKITIYMCGDSTMQDWAIGFYPKQGMGQDFSYFFDGAFIEVYNAGRGGTTSQTYYDGHWSQSFTKNGVTYPAVSSLIKSGDYVFIMFGANDNGYKTGEVNFKNSIGSMVKQTQAKGAYPILLSPIRRSNFTSPDSVYESYHAYPIFMRQVADSLKVPLIDLDTLSRNLLISLGQYYSNHYINMFLDAGEYSNYASAQTDNQHLQQSGANAMGRIVTEQLRVHSDANAKKLAQYLAPMYQVDVKVSPVGSDSVTSVSTYYPKGMTVTLKTTPKNGKKFLGWYNGQGQKVSGNSMSQVKSSYIHTFVMGSASTQYTAVYEGGQALVYSGDGKALTAFPSTTPKTLGQGTITPTSSSSFVEVSSSSIQTVEMLSTFDAFKPDSGTGFSESNNAGFHGEGFWNFKNEKGSLAIYRMVFPSAGHVTMGIAYANGGANDRSLNIYLDHDYYVSFPPTGSWTTWDTVFVDLDLISGEGELQFISMTDEGGPNIDLFGFSMENINRENQIPTKIKTSPFQIAKEEPIQVSVFDLQGNLLVEKMLSSYAEDYSLRVREWITQRGTFYVMVRQKSKVISSKQVQVK